MHTTQGNTSQMHIATRKCTNKYIKKLHTKCIRTKTTKTCISIDGMKRFNWRIHKHQDRYKDEKIVQLLPEAGEEMGRKGFLKIDGEVL